MFNLFGTIGALGANVAKNLASGVTKEKKKDTKDTITSTTNEHADYINKTYAGGLDAYTKLQNDRYNAALANNDVDTLNKLNADALRVGYKLTNNQPAQTDYSQRMNDLLSAIQTYQSKVPDIPHPDIGDYKFNDIQKQLGNLTNQLKGYEGAKYMNMDEAIARANSQLSGMYQQNMDKAISEYNRNAIQRGMFGQMPVEALKQQAIAENELNKSNAINALGANLYSQDFNMAQQKDQNYYQQINKLAELLGQQYNTELGIYQSDLNRYNSMYNQARQADQDYYDNITRQLNLLGTLYNLQNNEMDRYAQNIGQFSNDYMAEINKVMNDGDPSNDWQIGYLQNARNQKIAGQNQAQSEANSALYKQAMDMFGKLGYASGWIAEVLRIPEGTTTYQYANMLADNARQDARLSGGGSGGSGGGSEIHDEVLDAYPEITFPQKISLWNEAVEVAKSKMDPLDINMGAMPSQEEIYAEYLNLAKVFSGNPFQLQSDYELLRELEREMSIRNQTPKYYSDPVLSVIRNNLRR
jgi:hypothetical protein